AALVIITALNIYGVKLVALINNAGVVFEILGMVVFAVFLAALHNHQGVGVIFKTGGAKITPSTFLVGMFMSLFVIYGFDTASTLAEETKDPRREAPRAVRATIIAVAATAMIYLSWLLGNIAVMRARMKGWPRVSAPFKLGRWGKVVNILGIAWGAGMLVNFFWPASKDSLRVFANPKPNQTDFLGTGKPLVNLFGLDWLNKIPVIWTVTAVIVVIGLIYYFFFQRSKPFTPVTPPDEEVE